MQVQPHGEGSSAQSAITEPILSTFVTAVDVLDKQLGINLPFLQDAPQQPVVPKTVLVLGGNSELGRFITQLLRLAVPDVFIVATCYSDDPEADLERTWPVLWTAYSIDGDYESRFDPEELCGVKPNLVEHLKEREDGSSGFEVIIDVAGKVTERPEFRELLVSPKLCVCKEDIDLLAAERGAGGPQTAELRPILQDLLEQGRIVPISGSSVG